MHRVYINLLIINSTLSLILSSLILRIIVAITLKSKHSVDHRIYVILGGGRAVTVGGRGAQGRPHAWGHRHVLVGGAGGCGGQGRDRG